MEHGKWVSRTHLSPHPTDSSRFREAPREESIYSNAHALSTLLHWMVHPLSGKSHRHDDKACWTLLTPCHVSLLASYPISSPLLSVCISLGFVGWPLSWSGTVGIGYLHSYSDLTSCGIYETLPLSAATTSRIHPDFEPIRAPQPQLQRTCQRQTGEFSALARAWVLRVIFFPRPWPV